jgi:membrane associated rhomboid family serine protease
MMQTWLISLEVGVIEARSAWSAFVFDRVPLCLSLHYRQAGNREKAEDMLIPIRDDDSRLPGPGYVTIGILIANVVVFLLFQQLGANERFTTGYSVIPLEITTGEDMVTPSYIDVRGQALAIPQSPGPTPIYLTLISAMFMHGGLMHLLGNMLYLWIFGDNVEHRLGRSMFAGFYLLSGIAASFVQIGLDPDSVIPNLGASGAIAGVLGAYLVLFPRNRVEAIFLWMTRISIPAVVAIGVWIAFQIFEGMGTLGGSQVGGVAYGAHIGGFVAGALMALFIKRVSPDARAPMPQPRDRW